MNLRRVLANLQIEQLNHLQTDVLERTKKKANLLILAPTGAGKTLSFLLPVLQKLDEKIIGIQALIVVPSRELALQIEQVFRQLQSGFKVSTCYGGHSVRIEKNNLLEAPAVLIGTPGRLAFHIREQNIDLVDTATLVLDEFDKSLTLGFSDDMSFIVEAMENVTFRLLTSATALQDFPPFIEPSLFDTVNYLDQSNLQPKFALKKITAAPEDKLYALFKLICKLGQKRILIFCNHRDAVDRISELLIGQDLIHDIYHGGLEQDERERALVKFRNGSILVLIATDLASRGLDIPAIDAIIHYQLPLTQDAFVHRNGRTARMQAEGVVYLCLSPDEHTRYLDEPLLEESLQNDYPLPKDSAWRTLYLGLGKKNKVNKIDVVGFLVKQGGLQSDEIGLIEVKDYCVYVAVKREKAERICLQLNRQKIKGQKVKVDLAI
jgi:ATP-independent RNA helicase DbpA